jgi:hypothetical protein
MPIQTMIYLGDSKDSDRKIVVVDGQPYYQSTGRNSGYSGIWFPFILIRGNKFSVKNLPKNYKKEMCRRVWKTHDIGYIFKYEDYVIRTDIKLKKDKLLKEGRLPTKQTLIDSVRLGSKISDKTLIRAGLNRTEIDDARNNPITLEHPEYKSSHPDSINTWLIKQGAATVKRVTRAMSLADVKQATTEWETHKKGLFSAFGLFSSAESAALKTSLEEAKNDVERGKIARQYVRAHPEKAFSKALRRVF